MSTATLEAKLRLDIAGLQANLAKADGEIKGLQDRLRERSRAGAAGVGQITRAHEELAARVARTNELFGARPVNPWTTASAGARQYAQVLQQEVIPAMQKQAQAAWTPRTGEGMDSNRMLAQQALRERAAMQAANAAGRGGNGLRNLGQLSMQAQDIAVQLQMGTRASVVLAQQGSQLLSIFGPAGAIAGGAVAIGGALFMMGEKGREAFEEMRAEAAKFDAQMKLTLAGGIHEVAAGVVTVEERMRGLQQQMQGMLMSSGFTDQLASYFGAPTVLEKQKQIQADIEAARAAQVKLGERLVELSGQEVQIAELKARGETEKAEAMEREVALAREIAKISAMPLQGPARAQLIEDARARAASTAEAGKLVKAQAEVKRLEEAIHDAALENLEPAQRAVALAKEQQAIFASMATKGGLFHEQNLAGLQAWADALKKMGDTVKLAEVLGMLAKALELQKQMDGLSDADDAKVDGARERAEAAQEKADFDKLTRAEKIAKLQEQIKAEEGKENFAREMNSPEAMYEAQLKRIQLQEQLNGLIKEEADAVRDAQEKREESAAEQVRQHESLRDFVSRLQETEARAAGKGKQADQMEKQRRQKAEAEQLARDAGLGYEQALSLVEQLDRAEEKLGQRRERERGRGRGQNGGDGERRRIFHTGLKINSFTGLSNWQALQARTDAGLLKDGGMGSNAKGDGTAFSPRRGAGRPDHVRLGIIEKATGNVDKREQAGAAQQGVEALLRKNNELLARVMFGAGSN